MGDKKGSSKGGSSKSSSKKKSDSGGGGGGGSAKKKTGGGRKLFGAGGAFKNYVPPEQRKPVEAVEALKEVKEDQEEFRDDPPGVSAYPEKPKDSGKRISLGVDPYSIMMLHPLGREFFWALLILLIKLLFIGLLYYDLLREATDNNVWGLPAHQAFHIRVSQFISLLVAPYFLSDVTGALIWLGMRYEPIPGFPAATARRWYWVLFLRMVIGIAVTFVAFLLIMQSTSLTILFLNLQAILFLSDVDRLFIWLAHHGFLYTVMEKATRTVEGVGWTRQIESRKAIRAVMMIVLWLILIMGWTFVTMSYNQTIYLTEDSCLTFQVLMDDLLIDDAIYQDLDYNATTTGLIDENHKLRYTYFSGIYRVQFLDPDASQGNVERLFSRFTTVFPATVEDRLVYFQDFYYNRPDNDPNYDTSKYQGRFSFCSDQSGTNEFNSATGWWIFTVDNIVPNRDENEENESCPGWLMKSPLTQNSYTLQDVTTEGWEIWTGKTDIAQNLVLDCTDCATNVDCSFQGNCPGPNIIGGEDVYLKCACDQDRLGLNCEINTDCSTLQVNLPPSASAESSSPSSTSGEYQHITKEGTVPTDATVASDFFQITGRAIFVDYGPNYANLAEAVAAPVDANVTIGALLYAGTRWYHGRIPALRMRDDLIGKFNDQTSSPIWDAWILFDYFDYATNPTKRGNPIDDPTLNWFPVEVVRNTTTGLISDVIVLDDVEAIKGVNDDGIVVCQSNPNEVVEPFFTTVEFCDPSFLSYDTRTQSCPVDLSNFKGRAFGYTDESGSSAIAPRELTDVNLSFDNNINTLSSHTSLRDTFIFTYELEEPFDSISFAGYSIHFGPNTDLNLIKTIGVDFCQFGFECRIQSNPVEYDTTDPLTERIVNVEFSNDVRSGELENLSGDITFTIVYGNPAAEGSAGNANRPVLEIQELKLFGNV